MWSEGPFVPLTKDMTFDICLPIVTLIFSSFQWFLFFWFLSLVVELTELISLFASVALMNRCVPFH